MEYLWIYTGTCEGQSSWMTAQAFAEPPTSRIVKRAAADDREQVHQWNTAFLFSPEITGKSPTRNLLNKRAAERVFQETNKKSHLSQYLKGLIDAASIKKSLANTVSSVTTMARDYVLNSNSLKAAFLFT